MKKLISVFSILFLGLFIGSVNASEPSLEGLIFEQPDTVMSEGEAVIDEPNMLTVWPFHPSDTYPDNPEMVASRIDDVKPDLTVDEDGQTQFPVELDDPTFESD